MDSNPSNSPKTLSHHERVERECLKIITMRSMNAIICSIFLQFLILTGTIIVPNLSLLHPLTTIYTVLGHIFSIFTWFRMMPIVVAYIVLSVHLRKEHMEKVKQTSWFHGIFVSTLSKSMYFLLHWIIGVISMWQYSHFITWKSDQETSTKTTQSLHETIFNEKSIFITIHGLAVALFTCYNLKNNGYDFPAIHQRRFLRIKAFVCDVEGSNLLKALVHSTISLILYNFIGRTISIWLLETVWQSVAFIDSVSFIDFTLLMNLWILSMYISISIQLPKFIFQIYHTERIIFPIEQSTSTHSTFLNRKTDEANTYPNLSLSEALTNSTVPLFRQLAALDLYNLAESDVCQRKQQIYALTVPGGHPKNWKTLLHSCLAIINEYRYQLDGIVADLQCSIKTTKFNSNHQSQLVNRVGISKRLLSPPVKEFRSSTPTTATEMAELIMQRQQIESDVAHGNISPIAKIPDGQFFSPIRSTDEQRIFKNVFENALGPFKSIKSAIGRFSQIFNVIGTNQFAKLERSLSIQNTQELAWVLQGLANIAASSLREDRYGVVQLDLPEMFSSILQLNETIGQITSIAAFNKITKNAANGNGKQIDGLAVIRNAIQRSLYMLSIYFGDYLNDIIDDPKQLNTLRNLDEFSEL